MFIKKTSFLLFVALMFVACNEEPTPEGKEQSSSVPQVQIVEERDNNESVDDPSSEVVETEEKNETEVTEQSNVVAENNSVVVEQPIVEPYVPPVVEEPVAETNSSRVDYQAKFMSDTNCDEVLDNQFFLICYDYQLKVAKSVSYTLAGDLVNELNIVDRPSFYEERSIDESYRAKLADYVGSGYDRGHLAPDASFDWSQESLEATYSLANIIPQAPTVNRYMWLKAENYEREKAMEFGEVTVVNVIKYSSSPLTIGENNISISIGYYKMILNELYEFEACYYYANDLNSSSLGDILEQHKVACSSVSN